MEFLIPLVILLVLGAVIGTRLPRGRGGPKQATAQGRATVEDRPAGRD